MREKERVPVTKYEEVVSRVTCNRCGKKYELSNYQPNNFSQIATQQQIELSFSSTSMFSSQKWKFDLCEECLLTIVKDFALVPEGFIETALPSRFPQLQFDSWKQTGKWDWRYGYTDDMLQSMGIYTGNIPYMNEEYHLDFHMPNTCSPERAKEITNKIIESLKKKGIQL